MKTFHAAACAVALTLSCAQAQPNCRGTKLSGVVHDSTSALIPGAAVVLDDGAAKMSGSDGSFVFSALQVESITSR